MKVEVNHADSARSQHQSALSAIMVTASNRIAVLAAQYHNEFTDTKRGIDAHLN
jgi:hypothetical protein